MKPQSGVDEIKRMLDDMEIGIQSHKTKITTRMEGELSKKERQRIAEHLTRYPAGWIREYLMTSLVKHRDKVMILRIEPLQLDDEHRKVTLSAEVTVEQLNKPRQQE